MFDLGCASDAQARLRLLFDFRGSGFDELRDRCGLRNIDCVATCVIDGVGAGALAIIRWASTGIILSSLLHEVPTGLSLPGGLGDRTVQGLKAPRNLGVE
jgi:hypothetical protein